MPSKYTRDTKQYKKKVRLDNKIIQCVAQQKALKITHCFTFRPSAAEAAANPASGGYHMTFWLGGAQGNVTLSQWWIGWDGCYFPLHSNERLTQI